MEDINTILDSVKVCQKHSQLTHSTSYNKLSENYQAIIMHAGRTTKYSIYILTMFSLYPATYNYPLALLPIANKALLSYQIEYLERNNVHSIFVVIEKKYFNKIDTFFRNHFKASSPLSEIELVVLQDEEESANILKLLKDKIDVSLNVKRAERCHRDAR